MRRRKKKTWWVLFGASVFDGLERDRSAKHLCLAGQWIERHIELSSPCLCQSGVSSPTALW